MKPTILDTFCKAGGAGWGYAAAGFDVVGVDIEYQPRYPFEFHQADAIEFIIKHGHEFDFIHASPPCQHYSRLGTITSTKDRYPDMVAMVRNILQSHRNYIIENVPGAPLINPLTLCGTMFGLKVIRHRLFETSFPIYFPPASCNHHSHTRPTGNGRRTMGFYNSGQYNLVTVAGHTFTRDIGRKAMGISWMTRDELSEAIPPKYTEFIGKCALQQVCGWVPA